MSPTYSDRSRHGQTELYGLTVRQEIAIAAFLESKTQAEAAKEAGVTRQTVSTWAAHHPAFIAALNARRREISEAHADRLRQMRLNALEVIDDAIERGDSRLALEFWRASGGPSFADPIGPSDPEGVITARAIDKGPMSLLNELEADAGRGATIREIKQRLAEVQQDPS